jgi:TonB-linked SusC/RagA family outer membrane protein
MQIKIAKTCFIMRMTACLLLGFSLHLSARTTGQTISYTGVNVPLTKVFDVIKQQTGYLVVFNADLLEKTSPVTVAVKEAPLEAFLQHVLDNQPLEYSIENKTIIVSEKTVSSPPVKEFVPEPPLIDVQGYVYDSLNRPINGVSVMIRGTKRGTQTDESGLFKLHNLVGNEVLIISATSYELRNVPVDGRTHISVVLKASPSILDQTVVQAYGTTSRRFSVGSITTVTSADIERQPVPNALAALQGLVPGLVVTPTGGTPGASIKLQIRGQNTMSSSSPNSAYGKPLDQPLFFIDGVPFAPQNTALGDLYTFSVSGSSVSRMPGNGISPFIGLNPADIESISILRDADATSIYGSQGANGVILITTKKGKPGKPTFNITANSGVTLGTVRPKFLNTQQYLSLRHEALANDKITLTPATTNTYPDLQLFDTTRYVDWYKQFFTTQPRPTDVHFSLSGGQQYTTFILSGGYTHTPYNFAGGFADNRFSLHSAYTYRSPNNKLSVQFGTDYSYDKNNAGAAPKVTAAMSMPPDYTDLVDKNGNLIWYYKGLSLSYYNQYALLRQPASLDLHTLNASMRTAYTLLPGLSLSANLGYSRTNSSNYTAIPLAAQDPKSLSYRSSATFGTNNSQAVNIEPQLDYKRNIGGGVLSLLAGGTYRRQTNNTLSLTGQNYPNDDLLHSINGAGTVSTYDSYSIYKYAAGYARIGYVYDRKYILNFTGRRDGSSNFGPGRRWGNFGSAGAGWIFTEEGFWPRSIPFMSFGKLSGNFGTNGSDGIAPYNYQAYYTVEPSSIQLPFQGFKPYTPTNLFNPDYSWGTKKSYNAAMDLGFFKDRLLVNVTWYQSRTSNQLLGYQLPTQTGFNQVLGNFPATVQNRGMEFYINSTNIQTKDFKWTTTFNIAFNRNKLIAFPGLATSPYASQYTLGKSTSIINGYKFKGVNDTTGIFQFYKGKGGLTYAPSSQTVAQGGDWQPLFDIDPKYTGGLGNTFTYKGLSVTLFFQFAKQTGRNYLSGIYSYGTPGQYLNVPVVALDHWRKLGDQSAMQKASTTYGDAYRGGFYFNSSSGAFSDASYVRLKTVSLSWQLSEKWVKKAGMKDCRFYCNAQNLLTFTGYKVGDPEMNGAIYAIPLQRVIVGGLSVNF